MKMSTKVTLLNIAVVVTMLVSSVLKAEASGQIDKDDDNRNPVGCRDVGFQFELKTLHLLPQEVGEQQSMYMIFNQLKEPINLYQMRDAEARTLYLNHSINQQQWGVFSTGEKDLKFICTVNDPNFHFGRIVDCAQSLHICEFAKVKYGMNNRGNYWLVNSYTRNSAVNAIIHYGIIPDIQ